MHSSARQALIATVQQYFSIPPAEAELVLGELDDMLFPYYRASPK